MAMAEGPAGNTTLGHGMWRRASVGDSGSWGLLAYFGEDARKSSLWERPYANYQVSVGGMEPLELTVLVTIVLAVMLVGVTKPRLLILLLALCLVVVLMPGLLPSSAVGGPDLFGHPSQLRPAAGYTEEVNALRQQGPATVPSWQEPDTSATERPVGDAGGGDSQTGEATGTEGLSSRTSGDTPADDDPPQSTRPSVKPQVKDPRRSS